MSFSALFRREIVNWLGENERKINYICRLPGGFEIWFQCEMACFFNSNNVFFEREVNVYRKADLKADFLLHFDGESYVAELKCQSFYNRGAFYPSIIRDIEKFSQIKREYKDYRKLVFGLITDGYGRELLEYERGEKECELCTIETRGALGYALISFSP